MRARNIKPGFFQNDELAELPFAGRLLFVGLWCVADREGRLEDKPKKIRGLVFPYDDFNGEFTVNDLLDELEHRGFIRRYMADGRKLILVENFSKHQAPHHTEKKSELPGPESVSS